MTKPNFLIIGTQKAGTTSLYQYLKQHPQIYMSSVKEPMFFIVEGWRDGTKIIKNSVSSYDNYWSLFDGWSGEKAIGEASIMYLSCPWVAQRIQKQLPGTKLIIILRNPIERAFSHYMMHVQLGQRLYSNIESDIWTKEERIFNNQVWEFGYIPIGQYYNQLERYFNLFPKNQIRVYLYEELQNIQDLLRDIFNFLEVDNKFIPDTSLKSNAAPLVPRNQLIHNLLESSNILTSKFNFLFTKKLTQRLITKIQKKNLTKPSLAPKLRKQLVQAYREEILKIQNLLGRDLSGWLQ